MGAQAFENVAAGKTAREAFDKAIEAAQWEHGHGGYSGTIAEKHSFVMIRDTCAEVLKRYRERPHLQGSVLQGLEKGDVRAIASALMDLDDERISDKWGPAGCVELGNGSWMFFGWASS